MKPELIISSILICYFSLYFFQKLFLQKGILDKINFRSSHTTEATRNGGIGLLFSVLFISIVFYIFFLARNIFYVVKFKNPNDDFSKYKK